MTNNYSQKDNSPENHTRVNDSFLARNERVILLWLAERMPPWVTPDLLTLIAFLASILIFASYILTLLNPAFLWLASLGFVINWFGDSLDGNLARYRHIERPRYGYFIDHMVDTIGEVLVFIGLGLSPYLRFDLAMIALVAYLVLSIYVFLATTSSGIFRISYGELGPTFIRLLAIAANTLIFFVGKHAITLPTGSLLAAPVALTLYDLVVVVVIFILAFLIVQNTLVTAAELSREDREARKLRKRREQASKAARRQARREERQRAKAAGRTKTNPGSIRAES
jgi:archaetidylinositol phosphate synthase